MRARRVQSPRRPPGCISTTRCWQELAARGIGQAFVTLHVGAGTFHPVKTNDLSLHRMHREWYRIPQETADAVAATIASGGRIIAVGTTSLRALESAVTDEGLRVGPAETTLFVTPGFRFRVVDALLTNFHLPQSTLLMLVSAFAGYDNIRAAYAHAIAARYRFFSYGDAMLLERSPASRPRLTSNPDTYADKRRYLATILGKPVTSATIPMGGSARRDGLCWQHRANALLSEQSNS